MIYSLMEILSNVYVLTTEFVDDFKLYLFCVIHMFIGWWV